MSGDERPDGNRVLPPRTLTRRRRGLAPRHHAFATTLGVFLLSIAIGVVFLYFVGASRWFVLAGLASLGAVIAGRLLGERLWPILGGWTSVAVLGLYVRWGQRRGAKLVIAPDADFVPGTLRQTWESMAFASALAILAGASLLDLLHGNTAWLPWLSLGALTLCIATTFLLVPHWVFARLGLRVWQPRRFLATSLAESYASFVRVSNGTLLVFAAYYGFRVMRALSPTVEGYTIVALTFGALLAVSVAVFGTAAAYFHRHEERVLKYVAAEARGMGFKALRPEHAVLL